MRKRVDQFRQASRQPSPADLAFAEAHLPSPLLALFQAQHPRDIVHSAATARWLSDRGHSDPDLIVAALLHDTGKGHQARWHRVAHVLMGPAGAWLAAEHSHLALRTALWRSRHHSALAVPPLIAAGASERVVELARLHHAEAHGDGMLSLLQEADAAC